MQLELSVDPVYRHGGRRPGAGRPKTGRAIGLPHRPRPYHDRHYPAHVTWRLVESLPSMRRFALARVVGQTIRGITGSHAKRQTSFRITHFSIQSNHLHLIVEAGGKLALSKGLQGLGIWLARRVNGRLGRRGRVVADRYHLRELTTPRAVRNAIVYVLQNHLHHRRSRYFVDECSSARWFTGWVVPLPPPDTASPVAESRTWLGGRGWLRYGRIALGEGPRS